MSSTQTRVVTLDYHQLVAKADLSSQIEEAYGFDGLGVLTVANVPGLHEARARLLALSNTFATLPEDIKKKYEHPESSYSFGWSHGKEKVDGSYDLSKGSYYANPQYDRPEDDEELIKRYNSFIHPNIWPTEDLPELEVAFKELGQLIVSVGLLIGYQCDQFLNKVCPSTKATSRHSLERVIATSKCCKARLLHYFSIAATDAASSDADHDNFSSWCGWHNDHGSLTGLVSAQFVDAQGNPIANEDPKAGLYCRNRSGELHKVNIPVDHIAFQIGETAQIQSGGVLQATPHAVKGSSIAGVSRDTFAVFMEPNYDEPMEYPVERSEELTQSQVSIGHLPAGVSPINKRWKTGQVFADFTDATLASYY